MKTYHALFGKWLIIIDSNQSDPKNGRSPKFRVKKAGERERERSGNGRRNYTKGR